MMRVVATLLCAAACSACTVEDTAIFVKNVIPPGTTCTFSASADTFLSRGTFDVIGDEYLLGIKVTNTAPFNADDLGQRVVNMSGADVELQASNTTRSQQVIAELARQGLALRTVRFSGSIEPGGSDSSFAFILIDSDQAAALATLVGAGERIEIIGHFSVFGQIDGSEIQAQNYDFPITLCLGCLVLNAGMCPLPAGTTVEKGHACGTLQDVPVTCCTGTNGLVCPATVAAAAK